MSKSFPLLFPQTAFLALYHCCAIVLEVPRFSVPSVGDWYQINNSTLLHFIVSYFTLIACKPLSPVLECHSVLFFIWLTLAGSQYHTLACQKLVQCFGCLFGVTNKPVKQTFTACENREKAAVRRRLEVINVRVCVCWLCMHVVPCSRLPLPILSALFSAIAPLIFPWHFI